ncbi:MAG TPA: hypothetical protein VK897_26730 [Anaerolineales bacterium]|nr:hypothetical protein [Anaerolineales bacterium]
MKKIFVSTLTVLLLVLALATATLAAAGQRELLLKGSLQATETQQGAPPSILVNVSGSGNATQLGLFTISSQVELTVPALSSTTSAVLVAADESTLLAKGNGQGTVITPPLIVSIVETYTITGGTGRFEGASGSFTVERVLNRATGISSGTINGTIFLP